MPKRPQYTKEALNEALKRVRENKLSLRAVARKYNIPRTTLQFKLKYPSTKSEYGPKPYLTKQEEDSIKEWLIEMVCRGFPIRSNDVLDFVQKYLNDHPRDTPFVNNRPGLGWLKAFFKRHPSLFESITEGVRMSGTCDAPFDDDDDKNHIDFPNFWTVPKVKEEPETDCVESEVEGSSSIKVREIIDKKNVCESKVNIIGDGTLDDDLNHFDMNADAKEKLMSFKDFINIIGDEALSKIMALQCFGREITEQSPILYKLWYFFKGSQKHDMKGESTNIQIQTSSNRTTNVNLINEENMTTVNITVTSNNTCPPCTSKEKSLSSVLGNEHLERRNLRKRPCATKKKTGSETIQLQKNKRISQRKSQKCKGIGNIAKSVKRN